MCLSKTYGFHKARLSGVILIWRPLWGWRVRQKWDVIGGRGRRGGLASVLDVQSLFFLLKKIGFVPWSDIMPSQTLIYIWQEIFLWIWRVTWFCFCFDFVHSHARCGYCSIVYLRFQVVQIKQIDCKMSTKNVNNYKQKKFCTHKSIKPPNSW